MKGWKQKMKEDRYTPTYFVQMYLDKTKYKEFKTLNLRDWEELYKIGKKNIFYIFQIFQEIIKFLAENVNNKSADIWCALSDNITCFIDPVDSELEKTKNMTFSTELLLKKLQTRVIEIEDLKYLSIKMREIKESLKHAEMEDKPLFPIFRTNTYFNSGKVVVVFLPYFQETKKTDQTWLVKTINQNQELEIAGQKINLKSPGVMQLDEFKFLQKDFLENFSPSRNFVFTWTYNGQTNGPVAVEQLLGALWRDRSLNLNAELHRQAAISQGEMPTI